MAVYSVNYKGLSKRETYDELIDYIQNKQDKIKLPNRLATLLRNSPELSNLLDGEGMGALDMEKHQQRVVNEQLKQAQLIETAARTNTTAAVLKSMGSQTRIPTNTQVSQTHNPKMVESGSQAWRPNIASGGTQTWRPNRASGGTQTEEGLNISHAKLDEKVEQYQMDIDHNVDALNHRVLQQQQNILDQAQAHLTAHSTPSSLDPAHVGASAAQAALSAGHVFSHAALPSGTQPMQSENVPRKRTDLGETGGHETKKRGRKKGNRQATQPVFEPLPDNMESQNDKIKYKNEDGGSGGSGAASPNKKKTKKEKRREALPPVAPDQPASSSTDPIPSKKTAKPKPKAEPVKQVGIEKIEGKPKSWWGTQNIATIKSQAELRGHRFSDLDTKGGMVRKDGKKKKEAKYKKIDYLRVLLSLIEQGKSLILVKN